MCVMINTSFSARKESWIIIAIKQVHHAPLIPRVKKAEHNLPLLLVRRNQLNRLRENRTRCPCIEGVRISAMCPLTDKYLCMQNYSSLGAVYFLRSFVFACNPHNATIYSSDLFVSSVIRYSADNNTISYVSIVEKPWQSNHKIRNEFFMQSLVLYQLIELNCISRPASYPGGCILISISEFKIANGKKKTSKSQIDLSGRSFKSR